MREISINIAINALKNCYKKNGIIAGATHFDSYWARDSFYASWGALELNDTKIVKTNLENFIKHQKEDGQIPIRIGASKIAQTLSFIGIKISSNKANYSQDKGFNPAIDPNLLFIITFEKYVRKTNDLEFAKKHLTNLNKAMSWLETFEKNELIYAGKYATWQDAVKKVGYASYTNMLYFKTTESLGELLNRLNIRNAFKAKSELIKNKINKNFYDKKLGYYIDFYSKKQRCEVFSSDSNFFAILFSIADKKQLKSILLNAKKLGISKDTPSYTNSPKYTANETYPLFYLFNMQGYHNKEICWPWIGCLHAIILEKIGEKKEAKEIYEKISKLIEKDDNIYETYEKKGTPVKRLFYKSEKEFAWGASFFILLHNTLTHGKRNK